MIKRYNKEKRVQKKLPVSLPATKQIVPRDPLEIRKLAKQSDMIKDMKTKFEDSDKNIRRDPNFNINENDIELLRSYVVASNLRIFITWW